MTEEIGVGPERVVVIPRGLAAELLGESLRPAAEAGRQIGLALMGTWMAMKGTRYAARAISELLLRNDHLSAACLGTGVPPARVAADFDERVRARLTVVPTYAREELPALLRDCHILVAPSLSEGLGVAVLEAMACGLVPVAADNPGVREFLKHGENGLIVRPADARALREGVERLVMDRAALHSLRLEAWATAQRYRWPEVARSTLDAYSRAARQRQSGCRRL
jgi:glycosyltransferase involved in cell wall biosynthesis